MAAGRCRSTRIALLAGILATGFLPRTAAQPGNTAEKLRRAGELMQAGKPDQAIPIYLELAAASPGEPSFGINLAIAQYKARRYQDAIEQCKALLKVNPEMFSAWLFLGASQLEAGDTASAAVALEKAIALNPADRNARVMLADALLAQDRYREAAGQFEEAKRAMPDNPRVLYGLNRCDAALALQLFERLEKAAPGSPEILALNGDFELARQQFARALQRYRQALAAGPAFPGVHASIALIYENTGHPDWARIERQKETPAAQNCTNRSLECEFVGGHFREITTAAASTPDAMYWQAKAFLRLSRQEYETLQKLPPSREKYEAEAQAFESSGKHAEAATAWNKALKLKPGDRKIVPRLALALCRSNNCVSALPLLTDALARDPSSADLNFLYGLALRTAQDARRALPYLETAVRLGGKLLEARAALGEAYLETGRPERAIAQLEQVITEDSDGSRHYQLARAYQLTGMHDQAAAALREYRAILRRLEVTQQADEARVTPP